MSESSLMFSFRIKPRPVTKEVWSDVSQLIEIVREESGNIANPIFADLMDYKYRTIIGRVRLFFRRTFWVALPITRAISPTCKVITFSAYDRDDYKALLGSFSSKLPDGDVVNFVGTVFTPCLSLLSIPKLLSYRKSFKPLLDYLCFDEKLLIYVALLHAIRVQRTIPKRLPNEFNRSKRTCVFLNSANAIESAWARSLAVSGSETISLQHGIFIDFNGSKVPFDHINYCNITADLFVGWSQVAVEVIKRHMPTMRCKIGGRLGGRDLAQLERNLEWKSYGRCICVLGRDFHFEHNIQLMTFASTGAKEVYACFHPTSDIDKYKKALEIPLRVVQKSSFSPGVDLFLVGNSSIYYDLILSGHAAILFSPGNNDFQGLHSFRSTEELNLFLRSAGERLLKLSENQSEELKLVVGLGVDNYDQIFNN